MLANRIKQLEKEHTRIDHKILMLEKTGRFTDTQLHELKKQKLHIKDELSRLYKEDYEERQRVNMDEDR